MLSAWGLVAGYSVLVGIAMTGMWVFLLLKDQVPELHETKTRHITLHIVAEFLTAVLLIVSGAGLVLSGEWARTLSPVALGMLLYTCIVSAGKYADDNDLPMVAMFGVLIILTIVAILAMLVFSQG